MTPTYRDARDRVQHLPRAEQDAYLRRLLEYREELERAGVPWAPIGHLGVILGFGLTTFGQELPGQDRWMVLLGVVLVLAGFCAHRVAGNKKRAYERAHPFES